MWFDCNTALRLRVSEQRRIVVYVCGYDIRSTNNSTHFCSLSSSIHPPNHRKQTPTLSGWGLLPAWWRLITSCNKTLQVSWCWWQQHKLQHKEANQLLHVFRDILWWINHYYCNANTLHPTTSTPSLIQTKSPPVLVRCKDFHKNGSLFLAKNQIASLPGKSFTSSNLDSDCMDITCILYVHLR